jgi:beta-glucanase (GH16 family)
MQLARAGKVAAAIAGAGAVALFGVVAAKEITPGGSEGATPLVTTFCSRFVPNMEASSYYARWGRQNPVELGQWILYRDSICAGLQPAIPAITTDFGKALVAAGAMALEINPVPTPTTTTTTTAPPTTTTTTTAPPTTTTTTTPVPSGEPGPITGQGYHLAFDDEFNTLDTTVWKLGNWYTADAPQDYSVSNGILSILNHPVERKQRDLYLKSRSFVGGYFEARMRYTRNTDAWASMWMMSANWIDTYDCTILKNSELDVFESFHNLESPLTWRSGSFALHRNTKPSDCGIADDFHGNWVNDTGIDLAGSWHTFAALWTATTVTWYIDDKQIRSQPVWDTTNQPMRLLLAMWSHSYTAELKNEVDWVRVWQK